jgi:hypothetical protein
MQHGYYILYSPATQRQMACIACDAPGVVQKRVTGVALVSWDRRVKPDRMRH